MLKLNSVGILTQMKTTAMTTLLVIFKHIIKYRLRVHYLNQIGKKQNKTKQEIPFSLKRAHQIHGTKV